MCESGVYEKLGFHNRLKKPLSLSLWLSLSPKHTHIHTVHTDNRTHTHTHTHSTHRFCSDLYDIFSYFLKIGFSTEVSNSGGADDDDGLCVYACACAWVPSYFSKSALVLFPLQLVWNIVCVIESVCVCVCVCVYRCRTMGISETKSTEETPSLSNVIASKIGFLPLLSHALESRTWM